MTEHRLWYDRPATLWTEALPLGNGRLGAMVFGRPGRELVQLNDSTAWSGSPLSEEAGRVVTASDAADALSRARAAVEAQDFAEAEEQVKRLQHRYSQSYLPFADLTIEFGTADAITDYTRELDLQTATHTVSYTRHGRGVRIEQFISHRHGVLVIELSTDDPEGLDLALGLDTQLRVLDRTEVGGLAAVLVQLPADVAPSHEPGVPAITWSDDPAASMQGAVVMAWRHDGAEPGGRARAVHRATVVIATETTFAGIGQQPRGTAADAAELATARVERALADLGAVRREHLEDHLALYGRSTLTTGPSIDAPLDRRLASANAAGHILAHDPALAGLLFNYGRYLLVSSSRPGGTPANLQGIWNNLIQPPWSSNFTTNINVEMNYWPAEVGNLAECAEPYYDLLDALADRGRATARRLYDAPGWVAHHNTDIWAYTQPVGLGQADPKWAFWPLAPAWLIRQLWEHLRFGGDERFARERAWPVIRPASEFMLAWLIELPDGTLGTSPSTSPENQFSVDGESFDVAASSTLDLSLIAETLGILVDVAHAIGQDDDPVARAAAAALPRIPGPFVGRDGLIAEWAGDFEHPDPTHRHLSNLYFLHPGETRLTPALADAASRTLDSRGDESTGWSLVWKIAMRARLRQPAKVADVLELVFRDMETDRGGWAGGLYPNLLAAHPPFQIDGNFGYVSGIAEAILQSHRDEIELLPAVPDVLASGSARGLVARPGVEVSLDWSADASGSPQLDTTTLRAIRPAAAGPHTVRYRGRSLSVDLELGTAVTLAASDWTNGREPR